VQKAPAGDLRPKWWDWLLSDLAVAAVMAHDRACHLAGDRGPQIWIFDAA